MKPVEINHPAGRLRRPRRRPLVEPTIEAVEGGRPGPWCFDDIRVELCLIEPWVDGAHRHFHFIGDSRIRERRRRVAIVSGVVVAVVVLVAIGVLVALVLEGAFA